LGKPRSQTPTEKTPGKRGAPRIEYDEETALKILTLVEDGGTVDEIFGKDGIPSWETVRRWRIENEDFARRYARAYAASAESLEQQAIEVSRTATDKDSAAAARVQVDVLKWAAAKRNPKMYGDKVDVNHSVEITTKVNLGG
jgi:hypothetical protein